MTKIIAFFDFDGTITNADSFLKFINFVVGNLKFLWGFFVLAPVLVLYKFGFISNYTAKQKVFSWFFKGYSEDKFLASANEFSLNNIDKFVRPKALEKLKWHKKNGHKIVIVSASVDCWLLPWCKKNGYEIISTQIEFKKGFVTGKFLTKNCYGQEKVNRIKKKYNLNDFGVIYAYGDSRGDKEMLSLGHESFYKPFC
jgi:HAD superfamily hydrolase (TIGR01490 family)